jgi:membrane-bound ClpP family serine protease
MTKENKDFPLAKKNYYYILGGMCLIIIGFILMIGGGSEDPSVFNPDIFNTQRITIAPIIVLSGYIFIIYAIMKKVD